MKDKFTNTISNKYFKLIALLFISILFSLFLEKFVFTDRIVIDRVIFVMVIIYFIGLNFILDRKKLYDFIYKKRFLLAIIILIIFMILGYHGTSLSYWDNYIQPDYTKQSYRPFWGKAQPIRSDEWAATSPVDLSQSMLKNPFSSTNNLVRGTDTKVTFITKSPILGLSILVNPFKAMFCIFGNTIGMSFFWFARLISLLLVTFEFIMLFTNKNKKMSLIGSLLITFAPPVQWWFSTSLVDILIFGELAIILENIFINAKSTRKKLLISILFAIVGSAYICTYYPAWQIVFGYVYLIFFIWILIKNKTKLNKGMLFYLIIIISIIAGLVGYLIYDSYDAFETIMNTAYPGKRFSNGGTGWELLFTYFSSYLYSFKDMFNPCENSQFLTLFPLPFILGFYSLYKEKKQNSNQEKKRVNLLLLMLIILALALIIWNFIKLPDIIAKISLLYMSTPQRSQLVLGYLLMLILIILFNDYGKYFKFNYIISFIISLVITLFAFNVNFNLITEYLTTYFKFIPFMIIILFTILFLLLNNFKKYENFILTLMILFSALPGFLVNPITKNLDVMYDKPVAKFVRKITLNDQDSKWLVVSDLYLTSNYFIVNGAPTVNSINIYPNNKFFKQFDTNNDDEFIYNRYSYVVVNLSEEVSDFSQESGYYDLINLNINMKDLPKTGAKYIVFDKYFDEKLFEKYNYNYEKIYDEYGIKIYELEY